MKISLSEGYEKKLEKSLLELEQQFDTNKSQPIKLQEEWNQKSEIRGVIGNFARDKIVHLTQEDFAQGTLRVLVPCKLVLCESIAFNPNPGYLPGSSNSQIDPNRTPECDWLPHKSQEAYFSQPSKKGQGSTPSLAFNLGFFAAITIEHSEGTILDLNGFRLSCHPDFALQQRFHALIELANQPFVPGQGPSDFGNELRSAKMVWIRNGILGLSAHHGIHGNSMQDILISDVTFRDYEVAAISLNGGRRIVIRDCQLEGTFDRVPVLSTYSGSRFARLVGKELLNRLQKLPRHATLSETHQKSIDHAKQKLEEAICNLNGVLDATFNLIKKGQLTEIDQLFRNPSYFDSDNGRIIFPVEANPYGIALHSRGVLVNSFLCNSSKMGGLDSLARAFECTDITLERVNIAKTRGTVREVLALAAKNPESGQFNIISDSAGAVFRFFANDTQLPCHPDEQPAEMTEDGRPSLTVLGHVQIAIARLERALVCACLLPSERMLTKNIPPEIIAWADGDGSRIVQDENQKNHWQLVSLDKGKETILELRMRSNGDFMHHVNKGALGLFVQAVDGLRINRVIVAGVENIGLPGSTKAGAYQGPADGGHGNQEQQIGYSGSDARGIYVGACSNVFTDRIQAHGIISRYGNATGIEFAGGTEHATIQSPVVGDVTAGAAFMAGMTESLPKVDSLGANPNFPTGINFNSRYPNTEPEALGLLVDYTTRNIAIEDFQVTGVIEQPQRKRASKIRVEARLNNLSPGY